jgi:hypothetical protein
MNKPTTTYLQLPFAFDVDKLVRDLDIINQQEWSPMLYKHNYQGDWNSVALYAPDGDTQNTFAFSDSNATLKPTIFLEQCDYLKEVIHSFKAPILSARLLKLTVGSVIKPHEDHKMGYEDNNFRIHIPMTTNDQVSFILDGEQLKLLPGTCWYINANFTHSVSNLGTEDRVHLVIDLERNTWSDELFFSLAPKDSFSLPKETSQKELEEMISQLEKINSEASKNLIQQYKKKLNRQRLSNC